MHQGLKIKIKINYNSSVQELHANIKIISAAKNLHIYLALV